MSLADKLASKLKYNKSIESVSRRRTQLVRDSQLLSTGTFTGLILVLSLFLVNNTYATSSSITITLDDNIVDLNVAPTANGAFSKSSASKIGVATTNYTGYTLSISASGNNDSGNGSGNGNNNNPTALINGDKSLPSIENALTEDQFKALDSTAYNNQWGYLPSKYCSATNGGGSNSNTSLTCTTNTSFLPSPSTNGDILDITSTANTTVNEYEITLGARVDTTASLGSYNNTFLIAAVANAIPYTVTFVDNVVTDMPVDMSGTSDIDTVTISTNTPQRNGYNFIGWCTVAPTHNADGTDTCLSPGVQIAAGGVVPLDQTSSNNNFTLYAMWGNNYTIEGVTYMQDFATMSYEKRAKVVSSMVEETNYTLKDSRDNQDYTIAKLKDGNIWMTKNLNLAGGTTLTYNDTDFDAGYIFPITSGFGNDDTLPTSSINGFNDDYMAYVYNSNSTTCDIDSPCYSYYSWSAATLGSGANIATLNTDAPYSICPKGWRLPSLKFATGNFDPYLASYSEFYSLAVAYGMPAGTWSYNSPVFYENAGPGTAANFVLTGNCWKSNWVTDGVGSGIYYTSTSQGTDRRANSFWMRPTSIGAGNDRMGSGRAVRCILK